MKNSRFPKREDQSLSAAAKMGLCVGWDKGGPARDQTPDDRVVAPTS